MCKSIKPTVAKTHNSFLSPQAGVFFADGQSLVVMESFSFFPVTLTTYFSYSPLNATELPPLRNPGEVKSGESLGIREAQLLSVRRLLLPQLGPRCANLVASRCGQCSPTHASGKKRR